MPRIDPFFDKQPPLAFMDELRAPLYQAPPAGYGKRSREADEVDLSGLYLADACMDDRLQTAWDSFHRFCTIYKIGGDRIPVHTSLLLTDEPESFTAEITADSIRLTGDLEGLRRAIIWLEDELRRSEAPYLRPGTVSRTARIRSRITRCFFSPINRPPKFGDELSDDIDYYPDEYLNRLMHDGAGGVWIYTRFSDLVESPYLPDWGRGREARIEKLNRVIEKCGRYGIGVYVFAIEPMALKEDQDCPAIRGIDGCICVESEEGRDFVRDAGRRLMKAAPGIRGFISITYGERPTSCASKSTAAFDGHCPRYKTCIAGTPGKLLADNVEALKAGFREVSPDTEIISWTYGHRTWEFDAIREYVRKAPIDVMLMQNFDDMGYEEQLGVLRQGVDYWLSYIGPSELFCVTAEEAKASGHTMYAKMQVCCSHEIASVPYVPVPGILYKKYAAARALGVQGVMQCWYFGNYPSIMSKAAGELSFLDKFDDEDGFLASLAAIEWGRSKAAEVAAAWKCFEEAYRNYPLNIMFSYYGPAHDSVVWKLWLEPRNIQLPRTWQTLDPVDGDRIGEALLAGHTLKEALILTDRMSNKWQEGLALLPDAHGANSGAPAQVSVAEAIGILFEGTRNILEFYDLRNALGWQEGDPTAILDRMEALVKREIQNSRSMIALCEADGRLGYHSEGEGYKFFPEKLEDRIAQLENLLATEFVRVRARIDAGEMPLPYYRGEGEGPHYPLSSRLSDAAWEPIGAHAAFRAASDGDILTLELRSDTPMTFTICPEFRLLWPEAIMHLYPDGNIRHGWAAKLYHALFAERYDAELAKYADRIKTENGHILKLKLSDFGALPGRPMKLRLRAGSDRWIKDPDPAPTLGKDEILPAEYGWLMPPRSK